ncbi:hypothetical protein [Microtetraspora glauca]|uniref:Uncharacterized protein n=1 Tax=Microtetraspora glauca TaxID=1996 RepID=A0ABV3GC80_MICGL
MATPTPTPTPTRRLTATGTVMVTVMGTVTAMGAARRRTAYDRSAGAVDIGVASVGRNPAARLAADGNFQTP